MSSTISGVTTDEKMSSIQQILNTLNAKTGGAVSSSILYATTEYWAAMPGDMIILRHLVIEAGTLSLAFYTGTLDAANTTLEVTQTDSAGIVSVTTYASSYITSGLDIVVAKDDRVQVKVVVAGGGTNPTDMWLTASVS